MTLATHHKLAVLEYQKCIISLFWRPEVQNQGAGGMPPFKVSRKDLFRASLPPSCSSLTCGGVVLTSTWCSPCVCVCLFLLTGRSLYKDTILIQLGTALHWDDLIVTNFICNDPSSKEGHI